jgi:hypothetical protein
MMDKLRGMEKGTQKNSIAVDLFGTKAEDLQDSLLKLDPSKATAGLGDLEGATKRAGDAMGDTAKAKVTAFKRAIETKVTDVLGKALGKASQFADQLGKGFKLGDSSKATNDIQKLGVKFREAADWAKKHLIPALKDLKKWIINEVVPAVKKFYSNELKGMWDGLKDVRKAIQDNKGPLKDLAKFLKDAATVVVRYVIPALGSLAGRNIKTTIQAISLLIRWVGLMVKAFKGVAGPVGQMTAFVVRVFLGMVSTVTRAAAKAFGWVPGLGGKLKRASKDVEAFKNKVNAEMARITKGRTATVTVTGIYGGGLGGRRIKGMATGGPVPALAPGATEAYDSQPALLRVNEHVWTPEEVRAAGGHGKVIKLRSMAKRGLLQGLADGGPVGFGVRASVPSSAAMQRNVWSPITRDIDRIVVALAKEAKKLISGAGGVVAAARSQIGRPYSWGGGGKGGPSYGIGRGAGTYGFDCSGLTEFAWWKGAKVSIGGTTYSQHPSSTRIGAPRPGALGFPHMGHVMLASDRPGYVIQAPFTGSYVQEVRRTASDWRWPKGAKMYEGGPVKRLGADYIGGFADRSARAGARAVGIAGNPYRRLQHRADGGPVSPHVPYVVGERGPEVIVPQRAGTVKPAGSSVVQIDVHVGSALASKREIADTVLSALRQAKRGGVNVAI